MIAFATRALLACGPGNTETSDSTAPDDPPDAVKPIVTPVGEADWDIVQFAMFHAEVGYDLDDYDLFDEYNEADASVACAFPTPNHRYSHDLRAVTPGDPHGGPYDTELVDGVLACGYANTNRHSPLDMTNGMGVFFGLMVVPKEGVARVGSSPDGAGITILSNDERLPINMFGKLSQSDTIYADTNSGVPTMNAMSLLQDGVTHGPIVAWTNLDFFPPGTVAEGEFVWTADVLDKTGSGYSIEQTVIFE